MQQHVSKWMKQVLLVAGLYNLVWGAAVIAFPQALFQFAEMEIPRYPQIWQCVGMIVGVYGIGYIVAATDPLRHWPITLVGLLGKVFGPIGFTSALIRGELPLAFGITIISNDIIWWIPFAAILYHAFKQHSDSAERSLADLATILNEAKSHRGATLNELSHRKPTLVIFLRHAGCTFCRETLADLSAQRATIERAGKTLAVVHMSRPLDGTQLLSTYRLDAVHRFSDPTCRIYRAFGLERGNFWQLFGPRVWLRGLIAAFFRGHGIGPMVGDGFRMPGVFLLDNGAIVSAYRSESAADRPNLLEMASAETCAEVHSESASEQGRERQPGLAVQI